MGGTKGILRVYHLLSSQRRRRLQVPDYCPIRMAHSRIANIERTEGKKEGRKAGKEKKVKD